MGTSRPSRGGSEGYSGAALTKTALTKETPETPPPSVAIELIGGDSHVTEVALPNSTAPERTRQVVAVAAVGVIIALAFVALVLLDSAPSTTAGADQEQSPPDVTAPSENPTTTIAERALDDEAAFAIEQLGLLQNLSRIDSGLLDGLTLAWVGEDDQLQLRSLDSGDALPVSSLAQHDLPPLPAHVQLIGAENSTWLVDLLEPERSGKLSNSVRMVRLGRDLDSYGFIAENEDGPTDFFVGSLWGPAMNGTAQTPRSWTILPVAGTGIVVSSPTAESSIISGDGLEPLPRHVGRAVAASPDHIVGVACDNRLQCVGAVSRWDGTDQQLFDANALTDAAIVRISPDGRRLLSVIGDRWELFDLESDSSTSWREPIAVDDTLTWSPDSNLLFWSVQNTLVAMDVSNVDDPISAEAPAVQRISPVGVMGPRLPGSDVVIYDAARVIESIQSEG